MSQEPLSKLLSLSTELVLLILEYLPSYALVKVAQVCRRLHNHAIPVFLSRFGIASHPPIRSLDIQENTFPALLGLRIALYVTSVDDIWCKFGGPEENQFTQGIVQLLRFVDGLRSVSRLTLNVGKIDTRWVDGLATAASNTWKPQFIRLLDTVLERGCQSLTISHGHFLVASTLLRNGSKLEGPEIVPARTFLGLSLPRRKVVSRERTLPRNELTTLSIHSNMMLSSPFYEWMMQTLQFSPITSLSLCLSGIQAATWALILDNISLPALTSFAAETVDITFPAILLFLRRHSTVAALTLHPYLPHPGISHLSKPQKKSTLVPGLVGLGGSTANVAALLSHLHPDTAYRVHTFTLTIPMHQRVFSSGDFDTLGVNIADALRIRGIMPISLILRFMLPYEKAQRMLIEDYVVHRVKELLGCVEEIAFMTDGHFAFERWVAPRMSAWLGTNFPKLQRVRFGAECTPGLDTRGRMNLEQSVREACPGVITVHFEG
ncbi:hypothetical protein H0H92_009337 [Tricholoma furcatifolium]|nr:hypothetical protein H0H92_009337 [Tricholoma furcatifolium]